MIVRDSTHINDWRPRILQIFHDLATFPTHTRPPQPPGRSCPVARLAAQARQRDLGVNSTKLISLGRRTPRTPGVFHCLSMVLEAQG